MNTIKNFVLKIYNLCKDWIVANGVEGIVGLLLGLFLWTAGYKVFAGVAFGVFFTRNWDLLKGWVLSKIR